MSQAEPTLGRDEVEVLACPGCGGDVLETDAQCPTCGELLEPVDGLTADERATDPTPSDVVVPSRRRQSSRPTGVVRGMEEQQGPRGKKIRTFRLERHSDDDEPLAPIIVEMKGTHFSGTLREGDLIVLPRSARAGRLVKVGKVVNVRTGVAFRARGRHRVLKAAAVLLALLLLSLAVALAAS